MHLRTIWNGYVDMGRSRVPVLPLRVVMEDRDDGTQWQLSHSSDGEFIAINDAPVPRNQRGEAYYYGPFDGPFIRNANGELRLFVRGGYLGVDYTPNATGISDRDDPAVMTRRGNENRYREIIMPTGAEPGPDTMLAWVKTKDL